MFTSLDQSTWLVTVSVSHFSTYGVLKDTTPPMFSSTDPASGTMSAVLDKSIEVSFYEAVQPGNLFVL